MTIQLSHAVRCESVSADVLRWCLLHSIHVVLVIADRCCFEDMIGCCFTPLEFYHWLRLCSARCRSTNNAVTSVLALQSVQTDINRLVVDVQGGKTDAIQADASGLQQQFDALRKAIPRLNPKNSDKATIAERNPAVPSAGTE